MEDVIIIKPEKRSTIDKFKQWYYKKFIQTGKAAKFEEFIDKKTKFEKTAIKVIGTVTTIALLFCPADGVFGEICSILASKGLLVLVDVLSNLERKVSIKLKRAAEEAMGFGKEGQSEKVQVENLTPQEVVNDAKIIKDEIEKIENGRLESAYEPAVASRGAR